MTTLQEKIAALPEWPKPGQYVNVYGMEEMGKLGRQLHAALARLALAREWIEYAHQSDCDQMDRDAERPCSCGRDALLAALGEPNE
jgi:UDP-N-acetylmuramyl pentapeptide synthase